MKKPYLLIAGDYYYPAVGTGDWLQCFETEEEARSVISLARNGTYIINGFGNRDNYDWYKIVDLRKWTQS